MMTKITGPACHPCLLLRVPTVNDSERTAATMDFVLESCVLPDSVTAGNYDIHCYCAGNELSLASGTIAGYGTKKQSFPVTANQLTLQPITNSQYLTFSIVLYNDQGETDRWTPAAVAVIVEAPPPPPPPTPPPGGEGTQIPWATIGVAGLALVGVGLIVSGAGHVQAQKQGS
jgi:hypothetical protein